MFTGIISEIGEISKVINSGFSVKLGISSKSIYQLAAISDSIAVNGVCLTVVKKSEGLLFFDAVKSTLDKTNLKRIRTGDKVNLEQALRLGDKLGGHFVLGHIDNCLRLIRKVKRCDYYQLSIELPPQSRKNIIYNGSVAIEGVSLTVKNVLSRFFTVNIIPFTYENTNLKYKKSGDLLNVEFDYLLKSHG